MNFRTRGSATLTVNVPGEARVFVNGLATTSTGAERQFVSRNLRRGARYNYEIRAELVRDGKVVTETKSVQLATGETAELAFTLSGDQSQRTASAARTSLSVRVPADAKLYLAGKETRSSGPVRQFITSKIQPGQGWTKYTVRAVIYRGGKEISREQTISLKAGDSRELAFDFEGQGIDQVANATR